MSRIDVFYMQGKSCFFCCTWTNTVGIWSRFDVFVPLYVTICHVHTHIYVYVDVQISVYMCIYTHIYVYMCGKANCVAFIAICTLFRAYGQSLTFS